MRASDYASAGGQPVVVACPPGGFIHCTQDAGLLRHVADLAFGAEPGEFVVLVVEAARLGEALRWEAPDPPPPAGSPLAGRLFPHLYGPLRREAILAVRPARRAPDGDFLET